MLHKTFKIETKGSIPGSKLVTYILDQSPELWGEPLPLVLLCPGGGYFMTCDREAERVALQFNAHGYHVAILRYSTHPAVYPTALTELALVFALIRKNAKKWNVDSSKIVVSGFSAGAHLACSYAIFHGEDFLLEATGMTREESRPAGALLSYPVITSGTYAHQSSFELLLGDSYDKLKDTPMLKKMSLEHQVTKDMPPVFIWTTFTDDLVPVENSLLFVNALRKKNISTEFHMFPEGPHGLSLANEVTKGSDGYGMQKACSAWMDLACQWLKNI